MTLLSVENLSVDLRVGGENRRVLRDVGLSVAAGEALALVGESGSGKSMTARSIARLLPRGATVTGTVRYDGQDLLTCDDQALRRYRAKEMAIIFQDPRVHMNPVRTVGDYLLEGLLATGGLRRAEAEAKILGLLDDVGIADGERRMRQYPHELSGGLLQRVMIAAALAGDPRLLLADEPTTALDVSTQSDVMAILDELRKERGLALLFITHDLELAGAICDRVAVMYAGEIVEESHSQALLATPRHPYSAGLLGARPDVRTAVPRLRAVPGRPLAAFEAPAGCAFATRCAYRVARCDDEHPALESSVGARVRCLRASELALTPSPAAEGTAGP